MNHTKYFKSHLRKNIFMDLRSYLFFHYPINHNETTIPFSGYFSRTLRGSLFLYGAVTFRGGPYLYPNILSLLAEYLYKLRINFFILDQTIFGKKI